MNGMMFSTTKSMASTVMISQMVEKHLAADWRMIAYRLLRVRLSIGKSSDSLCLSSPWSVGTTASSTLSESMTSWPRDVATTPSTSATSAGKRVNICLRRSGSQTHPICKPRSDHRPSSSTSWGQRQVDEIRICSRVRRTRAQTRGG